jgi:hypothetical protein
MNTSVLTQPLIEQRPELYHQLFNGELPYNPLAPGESLGIAGFSRNIRRSGWQSEELQGHLSGLPSLITEILENHQIESTELDPASDKAVFSFIHGEDLDLVSEITTDIFTQWEIASVRDTGKSILSTSSDASANLVIETAAAVMQASDARYGLGDLNKKGQRATLTKLITSWGPQFASEWLDGTIISRWMDTNNFTPEEVNTWQAIFTPGMRVRFALSNISDPLKAVERAKTHLDSTLSDTGIAEALGISEAEAADVFTPGMRVRFASGNISDPLKAIERVKSHLDNTLSDTGIAEALGISKAESADVFTRGIRVHFAVNNIFDPLKAIERVKSHLDNTLSDTGIAEALGISEAEAADVFTPSMRAYFAVKHISDPVIAITKYFNGEITYGGKYRAT